ncbi:Spy0128 family protein [Thermophilibacter provencensis]|uniref:Spy0128 family protein n=1 Tax=Thermophilibacter provencensis TaxID=1852386 RepID=UPI003AA8AB6F
MQVLHQGHRAPRLRGLAMLAAVCGLLLACAFPGEARATTAAGAGSGHEPVTARVPVAVSVDGDEAAEDETFRFEITPTDEQSAVPAESVVSVDGAGETFFSFTFDRVGEHHYTVRQLSGDADGWTYDGQAYDVTVYCMWDESTDDLFTMVIIEGAEGYKAESCAFANSYSAPEKPVNETSGNVPSTGDATSYGPIVAVVCVGIAMACAGAWLVRHNRPNEEK